LLPIIQWDPAVADNLSRIPPLDDTPENASSTTPSHQRSDINDTSLSAPENERIRDEEAD